MSDDPWTSFGLWSAAKCQAVCGILRRLGVRYQALEVLDTEDHLKIWEAWDPTVSNPHIGYNLYIHDDDLELVGSIIVETFPERRFIKSNSKSSKN